MTNRKKKKGRKHNRGSLEQKFGREKQWCDLGKPNTHTQAPLVRRVCVSLFPSSSPCCLHQLFHIHGTEICLRQCKTTCFGAECFLTKLVEADVLCVLTKALTAHVQLVLADQSLLVRADHAATGTLAHADLLAGTPLVEMSHLRNV